MAFGNRILRTAVSLSLILVVLRNGLVGAAFTLTNAIGETYEVDEVAAAEHSQQFASLITDLGTYSGEVPVATSAELELIGRFIDEVPPNDVGRAAQWTQTNLPQDLGAQCRLVSAADRRQIHLLTTAIASTKRTWMEIVPMRSELPSDHYWYVVSHVPGIARLRDIAGTDEGNGDLVHRFIDDLFFLKPNSSTPDVAIVNDKVWLLPQRGFSISNTVMSTLLPWAVSHGEDLVVELLVSVPGVDVNVRDGYDWTPLHKAASNGNSRVVELLLGADGIDKNLVARNGYTAWDCVPRYWRYSANFDLSSGYDLGDELMRRLEPDNNTDADRADRRRNSVMGRRAAQEEARREQELRDDYDYEMDLW
ncbi:Ankyrin repeat domain-containing protein [Plasmodiophora brassicae]